MPGGQGGAVRNIGLLTVQQAAFLVGGLLSVIVVPRMLGVETYGRYAMVTSFSVWFVASCDLGFTPVISRYLPGLSARRGKEGVRWLFANLLTLRACGGLLAALAYLACAAAWFGDIDGWSLGLVAASVLVRAVSYLCYSLLLGLGQAVRWGVCAGAQRWLLLALAVPGFYWGGLRGVCLALLLTETALLAAGAYWCRGHLAWPRLRVDWSQVAPYLRFGLVFYAGHLLAYVFQSSGESIVKIAAGGYDQVGYFSLAVNIYLALAIIVERLAYASVPMLTELREKGRDRQIRAWSGDLLKWLGVAGVAAGYAMAFLGEGLVAELFGGDYAAVAANLLPLMLALLAASLANVLGALAVVYRRPAVQLAAEGVRLGAVWALGIPLAGALGSFGGCLAVLAATLGHAGYMLWRMRDLLRGALGHWAAAVGLGGCLLPALLCKGSAPQNLVLYAICLLLYGGLLRLLGVVNLGEVRFFWAALFGAAPARAEG